MELVNLAAQDDSRRIWSKSLKTDFFVTPLKCALLTIYSVKTLTIKLANLSGAQEFGRTEERSEDLMRIIGTINFFVLVNGVIRLPNAPF